MAESQARPPSAQDASKPRSKRFLTTENVADIVARYEAGETTQQLGTRYGISKTRVGNVLREQGVAIRRQGLSDVQVDEAATLYTAGKSLAWLGAHFDVSHTTVATALGPSVATTGGLDLRFSSRDENTSSPTERTASIAERTCELAGRYGEVATASGNCRAMTPNSVARTVCRLCWSTNAPMMSVSSD
jgi:hypothetical protein